MIVRHPKTRERALPPPLRTACTHDLRSCDALHIGAEYTPDEVEFLRAMERWMEETHTRFPTFSETLAVARSLGYKKIAALEESLCQSAS